MGRKANNIQQVTFPIQIHVSHNYEREIKEIIKSMIINLKEFEEKNEPLKYKIGNHISNNINLVIDYQ